MKLNKIFALMLFIVCFAVMLVSCTNDGDPQYWLDKYQEMGKGQPEVIETVTLDFYIIKGENMSEDPTVIKTVQDMLNQKLDATYHTKLNIKYISEADYAATVNSFTDETSGIVLINSADTMDALSGKLVNLYPYVHTDTYKTEGFGKLNMQITTSLMDAAIIEERGESKLFCIPNNHVIGSYELIVVDKARAFEVGYPYSDSGFADLTTWEETEALRNAAGQSGDTYSNVDYKDYNASSGAVVTRVVNVPYKAIAEIEANGYVVNISKNPTVDDKEVYSSAFAILNAAPAGVKAETYELRAMQIIYAINTNTDVRNLLQYGVENINYFRDISTNIITPDSEKIYDMKLEYTGDIFKAYYSATWTKDDFANGLEQNKDSAK